MAVADEAAIRAEASKACREANRLRAEHWRRAHGQEYRKCVADKASASLEVVTDRPPMTEPDKAAIRRERARRQ